MLPSLEIENFRTFRHLRIEKLGRVNLIVGKNNVGKTTLLEALRLYANRGAPRVIRNVLQSRDEISREAITVLRSTSHGRADLDEEEPRLAYENLFHCRKPMAQATDAIRIGPVAAPEETLTVAFEWYKDQRAQGGGFPAVVDAGEQLEPVSRPAIRIQFGGQPGVLMLIDEDFRASVQHLYRPVVRAEAGTEEGTNCIYVDANGLNAFQSGRLWDNIALTDLEEGVVSSLRIIAPELERVSLVGDPITNRDRMFLVRMAGIARPISLRSLGDGMNRLLGIALALVNASDGMLLVDEIENGIHYSVQPMVWRFLFRLAQELNAQVFATSHSWDAIEAFQIAAAENEEEGELIRLETKQGKIRSVIVDESDLQIVTEERIEVR